MDRHAQALGQIDLDALFRNGLRLGQPCQVNNPIYTVRNLPINALI